MKINNVELEMNLFDVEFLRRFVDCGNNLDRVFMESRNFPEGKVYDAVQKQCEGIHTFLDEVFGEGCSDQVLKKPYDLRECLEVYKLILHEEERQSKELTDLSGEIFALRSAEPVPSAGESANIKLQKEEVQKILKDEEDSLAPSVRFFNPVE